MEPKNQEVPQTPQNPQPIPPETELPEHRLQGRQKPDQGRSNSSAVNSGASSKKEERPTIAEGKKTLEDTPRPDQQII